MGAPTAGRSAAGGDALLGAGSSNQCHARDLVVALGTVKTRVLGKLGAANRTEAVARARQLGLIPCPAPSRPGSTFG